MAMTGRYKLDVDGIFAVPFGSDLWRLEDSMDSYGGFKVTAVRR